MNRVELSLPPSDADLLADIVRDTLATLRETHVVNISTVVKSVLRECPDTITAADVVEEILKQAVLLGLAIDFDASP